MRGAETFLTNLVLEKVGVVPEIPPVEVHFDCFHTSLCGTTNAFGSSAVFGFVSFVFPKFCFSGRVFETKFYQCDALCHKSDRVGEHLNNPCRCFSTKVLAPM
jgi:hypothetical protein